MASSNQAKHAVLDLIGASCTSCAIAIEHAGRRISGIRDIYVDRGSSTIRIEYDGDVSSLGKVCSIVERIGYEARIRETDDISAG